MSQRGLGLEQDNSEETVSLACDLQLRVVIVAVESKGDESERDKLLVLERHANDVPEVDSRRVLEHQVDLAQQEEKGA